MEITAEMVKDLRERTGIGMMECKAALHESGGDAEKAIEILRKKGHARAQAKACRKASEGIIGSYTDDKIGVVVEVNCESDFVARNSDFQSMVNDIAKHIAQAKPKDEAALLEQPFVNDPKLKIKDVLAQAVAKIGENIKISRFRTVELAGQGMIGSYIHSNNRIGVLVEIGCASEDAARTPEVQTLAKELTMQVAAAKPKYLAPADVPQETVAAEKDIIKGQLGDTKKPPEIIEKIVTGKLGKFFEEVCLLEQPYIRDDKVKIKDLVKKTADKVGGDIAVRRFIRCEIGQD